MDHKSFFFYPFSLANITVDLNQQRKSWWKLTVIISGSTWPFLPSSPDPVVKISVTANLAVVEERFQANIESLSMRDRQESPWEYIFNFISIIHLQPFQCHFLANKSYFPSFTFKKKFRVDQPKIKKLSNPIFQLVSPSESIMHPPCGQHWALLCVLALVSAWDFFWWPGKAGIGTGLRLGKRLPDGRGVGSLMEKTKPALGKGAHKE